MQDVPIEIAVPRIARMGYAGLELTVLPGYTTALERLDDAARKRIPALLREHGLTLTAIAAHSRLLDPPEYRASITRLREAVHLAVALHPDDPPPTILCPADPPMNGTPCAIASLTSTHGSANTPRRSACRWRSSRTWAPALSTPAQALWLIEQVALPNVGLNLDYSHFQAIGMSVADAFPRWCRTRCTRISRASGDVGPTTFSSRR